MMRGSAWKTSILPAAIIVAGFAGVFWLSGFIERQRPQLSDDYGDADLTMNGSRLKGYALGAEGLMADWYFMRSVEYIGYKMLNSNKESVNIDDLRDLNPRLLYPMLENATDLDPHFIAAYSYGAMLLPAIEPQQAIALASKGIANNPDSWRLYQHLAYIYWKLGQYEKASEMYEQGSHIAGAAPFMKLMAASMKTEGGSRQTARTIYREMLAGTDDEKVRITAERRLKELDSLDERDAIDHALIEFKDKTGRCPGNLGEIMPMLQSVKLPAAEGFRVDRSNRLVDPTDAPYLLDKEGCRVELDREHTALPVK